MFLTIFTLIFQFYGKFLWEGIQYPKEAIYLPHGLVHSVINIDDTVAITENYLFADALPGMYTSLFFFDHKKVLERSLHLLMVMN